MILASASARRKQLLFSMGINFRVVPANIPEVNSGDYRAIAVNNAIAKAEAVAEDYPYELVLGADTVIELEGEVIGKPANLNDAAIILKKLSGKKHAVVTAICLSWREKKLQCIFAETSSVQFKTIDDAAISSYISKVNVLDKAGAYAAQEYGSEIIDTISGSINNIIGLPTEKLKLALLACGYNY
jgi:septum formation protein